MKIYQILGGGYNNSSAGTYWDNSTGLPEPVLFLDGNALSSVPSVPTYSRSQRTELNFENKYLGNDNEYHWYAGMIFDCDSDDTAIPIDTVKWYLNDVEVYNAQVTGCIYIGEDYAQKFAGDTNDTATRTTPSLNVGAAATNTVKVVISYEGKEKTVSYTFCVTE